MKKITLYILILISITSAGFIIPRIAGAVECTAINTPDGCAHSVAVTITPATIKPSYPGTIAVVVNPDPKNVNTTIDFTANDSSILNAINKPRLTCPDASDTAAYGPQCLLIFTPTASMVGTVNIKYSVTVSKNVNGNQTSEPTLSGTLAVQVDNNAAPSTTKANAAGGSTTRAPSDASTDLNLGCTNFYSISVSACVAQLSYILFSISALVARFAGHFLDFFVYYSTNSSSYSNDFVSGGWGAVRDVANIFFIIALLYIAIKTILSLDGSHSKKLIANIIIIALIINFSLFVTKVVIDSSNILAKVFYNNISSSKDANAPRNKDGSYVSSATGAQGEKSISVGLVDKFDPQNLVTQDVYIGNPYTFIFMTLIIAGLLLYMTYVFFAVALLFVSRVVSLWISMIFAPLAFISYTVPFDIPGFGHKNWWSDLFKNAFLAPLFIFFLYIIVLFTGFLKNIINYTNSPDLTTTANLMQRLMSVIIPFILIVILLQKSKKLANEYSGDMGKAVMSIGKMVGGAAIGVAAGGAAVVGRAGVGRLGAKFANSEFASKWESHGFGGQYAKRLGETVGSASFDVRGIKVAGANLATTGLKVGDAHKGGFTERRQEQVQKRLARAKGLEVKEDNKLRQDLNAAENELKGLEHRYAEELHDWDVKIKEAQEAFDIAGPKDKQAASKKLRELKDGKSADKEKFGIKRLEKTVIPHLKLEIEKENSRIRGVYANTTESTFGRVKDFIFSGGQNSYKGSKEAAHSIRMGVQSSGGGKKKSKPARPPSPPKHEEKHEDHGGDKGHGDEHAGDKGHGDEHAGDHGTH